MKTIEESIATAMDYGQNVEIVPFLPYVLQDFWTLGTPPEIVINLIQRHCENCASLNILDLGCGKGAVSVKLAKVFKCNCYGIDGIPEFIEVAKDKAQEYGAGALCRFEVGDIRRKIEELDKFDIIILGAVGQVFGDYYTTLTILSKHLTAGGIIIINDSYIDDLSTVQHSAYLHRHELLKQFGQAGMELVDETTGKYSEYADSTKEMESIRIRCNELKIRYPEKSLLFEKYKQAQIGEYDTLENEITGSVMVVKRRTNI